MSLDKAKSMEERRQHANQRQKLRYNQTKNDPVLAEIQREKERKKYQRKKELKLQKAMEAAQRERELNMQKWTEWKETQKNSLEEDPRVHDFELFVQSTVSLNPPVKNVEKNEYKKMRRRIIKSDPVKSKLLRQKEKERYWKRREAKKLKVVSEMTEDEKELNRIKWRAYTKSYRQRKKNGDVNEREDDCNEDNEENDSSESSSMGHCPENTKISTMAIPQEKDLKLVQTTNENDLNEIPIENQFQTEDIGMTENFVGIKEEPHDEIKENQGAEAEDIPLEPILKCEIDCESQIQNTNADVMPIKLEGFSYNCEFCRKLFKNVSDLYRHFPDCWKNKL